MKRLMLIGAGKYQIPGIIKAKELGLQVVAIDKDPKSLGFKYADFHEIIDVKDAKKAIQVAKKYKINGVVTIASEIGVRTVTAVAAELGLPGLTNKTTLAVTNKAVMRRIFKKHNLPSPEFFVVKSKSETMKAIQNLKLPVIIKPVDNAGSRGVSKLSSLKNFEFSYKWAKDNSTTGELIVEDYLVGNEMTIEAISYKGHHEILAMSGKKRIPFPYCVSIEIVYPPPYDKAFLAKIRSIMKKTYTALGIVSGPTHSEVLVTKKGPYLVEVAGRGGGFGIFSEIVPHVSGVDIVKQTINIAMGWKADIKPRYHKAAVFRAFLPPQGRLISVSGLEEARKLPGVFKAELEVKPGDIVKQITGDGDRPGLMFTFGNTRNEVIRLANKVEKMVKFVVENEPQRKNHL